MIEISNVSKTYGQTNVVDSVTLSIPAGGITSIIGPNGAGKSTLLSMVSRLMPMSGGKVSVDGMDIAATPSDVLAKRLAILRQDNHLTARLTVRDLVGFGRYPHTKGRPTLEDKAKIEQSLDYLGMQSLADRFLDEISGGQRQRAFVAMILCQDTDYVLLDEPLNNLDMKHAANMMKLMRRACDELGKTVIMVLHDINFASWYSNRIVAMRDGRVVRDGTPAELMTTEAMQAIYGIDMKVQDICGKRLGVYYG